MVGFQDVVYTLNQLGVADVLLPFLLIFTVVFAIMQKTKPLGDDKRFNVVIALIMGLVVVIPHVMGWYPSQEADVVIIINKALPNVAIIMVAVLMVLLMVGMFGGSANWSGKAAGWVGIFAFLLVLYIFGRAAGWFQYLPRWLYWLDDPTTQAILLVTGVFGLIIWFIVREPPAEGAEGAAGKFADSFRELFGAGGSGGSGGGTPPST